MRKFPLFVVVALQFLAIAATAQKRELSEDQLLKGARTNITQPLPQSLGWIDDTHLLISKKSHPDSASKIVVLDCKTGKESPGNADMIKKPAAPLKVVSAKYDDIYLKDGDKEELRLTSTKEKEANPTLSPDNNYIAFTRDNDLYTINLNTKKETRLTHDGSDVILNGYASWIYFEEILGRATRYKSFWWSPDSKKIAFMRMDQSAVPVFPLYAETSQHGHLENTRYPKPGDPNPEVKIGFANADGGNIVWSDFNEKDDQYFGMPVWKSDATSLFVQWMNRGQDNLKIYAVDPASGVKKEVYDEKQKTWVDLDESSRINFLTKSSSFILKSDREGWDNLYLYSNDGTLKNKITSGRLWETNVLKVDEVKKVIYFTARLENSARTDFYKVNFDGKGQTRLSFGDFTHRISLSPGGSYFTTVYSNVSTPDRYALLDTKGKLIKELGDSKGSAYTMYDLAKTEIVRVKSADGLFELPVRIIWPSNYNPAIKYPVMINIYGGPNAGTVRDGWQFNPQQQWYAKEGLIQVTMDHRASGHFGKEGINYMHRNLGYWEMTDWIEIVKWLRTKGADSTRVGIGGFSYGGYATCYALTYGAGYFTHGLAGGSVVDWSLYDTHYTERFMDTPKENPEGYKSSSVLTHTSKYQGLIRIYHGTMDDNVHMQNSLQLIKKLQDEKKHFEFMLYPGGRHGWGGNQQSHSSNENNLFIYENLLKKEMPVKMMR
ncbi:S9 family peptidase [Pollutibacter soli]|uniref:S9 family peptidase n=1 Tax=Pollutibacter soli TaxID=3034157 RepID=UPI00301334FF